MDILTEQQHRALAFVASATRGGFAPTSGQVNLWLESPSACRAGGLLDFTELTYGLYEKFYGRPKDPVAHLVDLTWLRLDDRGGLRITELGQALLRDAEIERTDVTTVILDVKDPLAYAQLIGELAGMGAGMLIDPYLDVYGLSDLMARTSFTRILVSSKDSKKLAALGTHLQNLKEYPEVRYSSEELHDRVIVTADGVWTIGASLNTVRRQKGSTILMPVPREGVEGMRSAYEGLWGRANPVIESTGGHEDTGNEGAGDEERVTPEAPQGDQSAV